MRLITNAILIALLATPALAAGPASPDPTAVTAGNYAVEPSHTRVQFSVSHMGFSDWYGDFAGATGTLSLDPKQLAASKLEISIPVASVTTTNAKLDAELKSAEWFDADKHPTIRFVATKVERTAADRANITGDLTFHGVTKPVVLDTRFNGAGINPLSKAYTIGFNATTTINRSDFGVKTYVPLIGDAVTLRISAAFERAK
jgi:polyisoprenoid-binding protein YceI